MFSSLVFLPELFWCAAPVAAEQSAPSDCQSPVSGFQSDFSFHRLNAILSWKQRLICYVTAVPFCCVSNLKSAKVCDVRVSNSSGWRRCMWLLRKKALRKDLSQHRHWMGNKGNYPSAAIIYHFKTKANPQIRKRASNLPVQILSIFCI